MNCNFLSNLMGFLSFKGNLNNGLFIIIWEIFGVLELNRKFINTYLCIIKWITTYS